MSNFSLGARASSKSRLFFKKHFWSFSNFKHEFERRLQVWKSWKSSFRIFFSVRMRFEISQPFPSSLLCSLNLPRALFKNWEHFEQQQLHAMLKRVLTKNRTKKITKLTWLWCTKSVVVNVNLELTSFWRIAKHRKNSNFGAHWTTSALMWRKYLKQTDKWNKLN